ncbi:CHASE3 domain-containing protein [Streptomyces sp. V4-01]|uniref:histidine kinase n=1 Tax=Actinacidiphila polyblastidii TaxID=3110430 RepID=A0ABU7PK76_9ACTN|nr:CHASE3 domain-containing protein [Streptomyces sp. V4-01]
MSTQPQVPAPVSSEEDRAPDSGTRPARPPADTRTVAGRWTTSRWLTVGVSGALVALLTLAVLVAGFFRHSGAVTDQLVDHSSPALIEAVRLESALVDQETGTRGYALSGQRQFLEPYTQGLAQQKSAADQLRALTSHDRTASADLELILARADRWRTDVAGPIAAAPAGQPLPASVAQPDRGKAEFDSLRTALRAQQQHLGDSRTRARADLAHTRRMRNWIFSAIGLAVLALAVLAFIALRRGVNAPLDRLARQARAVADGDFDHPIDSGGPADMRALARDVEAMRRRLSAELATSRAARQTLDAHAADLARSNAELEQFAYVASHDLQEPLRKVASFCQLLQRRYANQLDERANQYIEFAVDGSVRMQTLISDLLSFSRVGRFHREYVQVDLNEVWRATESALSMSITESDAVLVHDELPTVAGDRTQLGMLLQNLIGNAIKFRSAQLPPRIELACRLDGDLWRFSITDNGIGIEPEFAERVFVIFQRLHARDAYPGNGIGLAMCKKVVEFHGGTIAVDRGHTGGTRILFTLPATEPSLPHPPTVPDAEPEAPTE